MFNNNINLTVIQLVLYTIVGYMMYEYLTWDKMIIVGMVLLGIQTITKIKGVTEGIEVNQMMVHNMHQLRTIQMRKNNQEHYTDSEELPDDLSVKEIMELIENEAKRMEETEKEDDSN